MPTTREASRVLVTQELGGSAFTALTTSAAGNAGGTTMVDVSLAGTGNDRFEGWWVVITSGTSDGEIREISDFVSSSGTITVREAFSAQIANAVTFELHRYNPLTIHNALNEAMKECYGLGHLFIQRRDESIVADNLLLNSDFETFAAGNFTSWTLAGAGASVAQSTSIFWHGADAAAVTAGAGAAATYSQAVNASPGNANIYRPGARAFTFKAWVYATAATIARLQATDGTDTVSSEYHTGNDGWELLSVTLSPGSNIGTVTVRLQVAAGGTGRIDAAYCYVERLARYTLPSTINDIGVVSVQANPYDQNPRFIPIDGWEVQEAGDIRYLVLRAAPASGTRLQLQGRIWLTAFSVAQTAAGEATTTEIVAPRTRLLALKAAELLMRWESLEAPMGERDGYVARAQMLRESYALEAGGQRMVPQVRSPMRRW